MWMLTKISGSISSWNDSNEDVFKKSYKKSIASNLCVVPGKQPGGVPVISGNQTKFEGDFNLRSLLTNVRMAAIQKQ